MSVVVGLLLTTVVGLAVIGSQRPDMLDLELAHPPESKPQVHEPGTPHRGLAQSSDPQLRLLGQYEEQLDYRFGQAMLFQDMPRDESDARQAALAFAPVLKEYAKQEVMPLVIFEPEGLDLGHLNFATFDTYFATLKAEGLTDSQMGTWVPLPEPNIPEWQAGVTDPALFANNFTRIAQSLKNHFPQTKTSVLLDSASYPDGDIEWEHLSYDPVKLMAYVDAIPKGLADSFGLQGFPWAPKANIEDSPNFDAAVFLSAQSVIQVAKKMNVEAVWLNTGTFASMYDWSPKERVSLTPQNRQKILDSIFSQLTLISDAGFKTTINIFAEDKRSVEADWSYTQTSEHRALLSNLLTKLKERGLTVSIFDTGE